MQAAHYYVFKEGTNEQLTFDDIKSLQNYVFNKPQDDPQKNDVVFHSELKVSGIQIEYNTHTGDVMPSDIETKKEITTSYHAFEAKLIPIKDAICWRAKHDLIGKLYSLNDPDINEIIETNQLMFGKTAQASHITLLQIQKHIKPSEERLFKGLLFRPAKQTSLQRAIYQGLKAAGGIDQIISAQVVEQIMRTIETKMKEHQHRHQAQVQRRT